MVLRCISFVSTTDSLGGRKTVFDAPSLYLALQRISLDCVSDCQFIVYLKFACSLQAWFCLSVRLMANRIVTFLTTTMAHEVVPWYAR